MYYFVLLLWQTKAVIWGNTPYAANWCKDWLYLEHRVSVSGSLTIAPSLKKIWTGFSGLMCWSIISESKLLTFWKPADTNSGICASDVSSLPVMRLLLFGYLWASVYQCSVRAGLVHGKLKNQTYFRYQLPSMQSQTCFSALCEPNTQTPTLLKKKISLPFFLDECKKADSETF